MYNKNIINKGENKIMTKEEEMFLKLSKEAEILQENGFELIEDYTDGKLSAVLYNKYNKNKADDLKHFTFFINLERRFVSVKSEISSYGSVWKNEICSLIEYNYSDVEDEVKRLIDLMIKLSK